MTTETVDQTDDSKAETDADAVVTESIAEEIETEQKVESDLNYSDDFTSSSTSSSLSSSADHIIKTTVLAKQKVPEVPVEDLKLAEATTDDSIGVVDDILKAEPKAADSKGDKKDALVESICDALMRQLIADTGKVFSKPNKSGAGKFSSLDIETSAPRSSSVTVDFSPVSPTKSRIEKVAERISVPLSPRSSRPIQEMMLTTFDIGSDSSEGIDDLHKNTLCL